MNADLRCFSVVLLLALMGCGSTWKPPSPAEQRAIDAIEEWGDAEQPSIVRIDTEGHVYSVRLNNTTITDAGLVHLKEMTKLRRLNLGNTKITDAGLEHLKRSDHSLGSLDLSNTKVTANGVKKLQTALPNCEIRWK